MRLFNPDSQDQKAKTRQGFLDDAHRALDNRQAGLDHSPIFLGMCIEHRIWEAERTLEMGSKVEPMPFDEFVRKPYPVGLGTTFDDLEEIVRTSPALVAQWEELTGRELDGVPRLVPIASIRIDGGTQSRVEIQKATVDEYAEHIAELPPVTLFHDGTDYWLGDGFHRVGAHTQAGKELILAHVLKGDRDDAVLHSVGANRTHGLRRTNADKRRAVEMLLATPKWAGRSDRWVAEKCGVSPQTVSNHRCELSKLDSSTRTGLDGKTRKHPTPRTAEPKAPAPPPKSGTRASVPPPAADSKQDEPCEDDAESETLARAREAMAAKPLRKPLSAAPVEPEPEQNEEPEAGDEEASLATKGKLDELAAAFDSAFESLVSGGLSLRPLKHKLFLWLKRIEETEDQ